MTKAVRRLGTWFNASAVSDERGLSTVEYTVILLLIAVFAIAGWTSFGSSLNTKISEATTGLSGISPADVQAQPPSGG